MVLKTAVFSLKSMQRSYEPYLVSISEQKSTLNWQKKKSLKVMQY